MVGFAVYDALVQPSGSRLGLFGWVAAIILVVVLGYGLLYAYRAFF